MRGSSSASTTSIALLALHLITHTHSFTRDAGSNNNRRSSSVYTVHRAVKPHPPDGPPPEKALLTSADTKNQQEKIPFFLQSLEEQKLTIDSTEQSPVVGTEEYHYFQRWDSWTIDLLKAELVLRKLPTKGKKAELIARLQEDDDRRAPAFMKLQHEFIEPLVSQDVQKDVSDETIKGAALSGAIATAVVGGGPIAAAALGLGAAYLSITPGKLGNVAREVGINAWKAGQSAFELTQKDTFKKFVTSSITEAATLVEESLQKSNEELRVSLAKASARTKKKSATTLESEARSLLSYRLQLEVKEQAIRKKEEKERLEKEKIRLQKEEAERIAMEKKQREAEEKARLEQEKKEAERIAMEKKQREAEEKARLEKEKKEAERIAMEKKQREAEAKARLEKEKKEAERISMEKKQIGRASCRERV